MGCIYNDSRMNKRSHDTHKYKPAVAMSSQCLAYRLRMMHRIVMGIYEKALRVASVKLRVSQMNILVAVMQHGSIRPTDLCQAMRIEASTLSRNVDRLVARGLIKTKASGGRAHFLSVTPQGRQLVGKALAAWEKAQMETTELMGEDGARAIRQLADRMLAKASTD